MKPRLFLSHSAKEADTLEVLEALHDHLVAAGFDVFLDRKRLVAGERWRQVLHNWMNLCHGAVLLVSNKVAPRDPEAVPPSDFVPIEASVLTNRRNVDPGFPFVVLQMDHVDGARLKEGFWKSLQLREEQILRGLTPASVAGHLNEITAPFLPLLARRPATPLEEVEEEVEALLRRVPTERLEQAAASLAELGGGWDTTTDAARELGALLLRSELDEVYEALRFLTATDLTELYYLVAPAWVDYRSVRDIQRLARGELDARGVATPGRELGFTPGMFVRRAASRPRRFSWPVREVDPSSSTDPRSYYETRVRAVLQEMTSATGASPEAIDEEINLTVEAFAKRPFFVALAWPGPGEATLRLLQERYPRVRLFLLTETAHQDEALLAALGITFLTPELAPRDERLARLKHTFIENELSS